MKQLARPIAGVASMFVLIRVIAWVTEVVPPRWSTPVITATLAAAWVAVILGHLKRRAAHR